MKKSLWMFRIATVSLATMACAASWAEIVIGQTVSLTGPAAVPVKEMMEGANLYIDHINRTGGIQGERIRLKTLDDGFDPKRAGENAHTLLADKSVLALFLNRGTPHAQAMLPALAEGGAALIAPSTGAMLFHDPVNRYVFNVRSSYQREAEKAVTYMLSLGIERMAVVYLDDTFGADGREGAAKGFKKAGKKPIAEIKMDRFKPDLAAVVAELIKVDAQSSMWIGPSATVVAGIESLRAADSRMQVVTLSNNASGGFVKALGPLKQGVVVSQVFPGERATSYPFIKEATELAKAKGLSDISPATLEGFAAAKVLVEGLRRASPAPTRAKIIAGLESIKKLDLGGLEISYSATDHSGIDFADLAIIGSDGKFKR